jgi:hypothetical protein
MFKFFNRWKKSISLLEVLCTIQWKPITTPVVVDKWGSVLAIFGGKRQLPPIMPPKIKLSAAIFCCRRNFVSLMMLHCLLNSINSSKYEHIIWLENKSEKWGILLWTLLFLWLLKYIESSDILHVTSSLNIHTILEQRPYRVTKLKLKDW